MIYMRGQAADYDGWRQMGCPGWGWDDVLPYFKKSECCQTGANEWRGGDGPLYVSDVSRDLHPLCRHYLSAGQAPLLHYTRREHRIGAGRHQGKPRSSGAAAPGNGRRRRAGRKLGEQRRRAVDHQQVVADE